MKFKLNYKHAKAAIAASLVVVAAASFAGPVTRANTSVTINAGVVVIDSNTYGGTGLVDNSAPFTFFALDRALLNKPAGWSFNNPFAPGIVSPAIENRWTALAAAYGVAGPGPVGSVITKQSAAYWEVPIDTMNQGQLNNYNVLLLQANQIMSLNSAERGLLKGFVDHGGMLWLDTSSTTNTDAGNGLVSAGIVSQSVGAGGITQLSFNEFSPLLTYPYPVHDKFTYGQIAANNVIVPINLSSAGFANLIPLLDSVDLESQSIVPVITDQLGRLVVGYERQGAGAILFTSNNTAGAVGGGFQGFTAPDTYLSSVPNGSLIINSIYLTEGFDQSGGNSHKTNGTTTDIGAPLLSVFKDMNEGGCLPGQTPVEYKGLLFVSQGGHLYAYSARPGSDLDANGLPDDGYPDWELGKGYDLVWESQALPEPLSAPVALDVPNPPNGTPEDLVFVVDGSGKLNEFPAFPLVNGVFPTSGLVNTIQQYSAPGGDPSIILGQAPLAPTTSNGLVYVTDNFDNGGNTAGRIWVVDPRNSNYVNSWCLGSTGQPVINQPITASATIGYIPIADNSGGEDEVVYVPLQSGGASGAPCGFESIWAGVVGEKHNLQFDNSGDLVIPTRAGDANASIYVPGAESAQGIHVSLITSNGTPLTVAQMNTFFTGPVTNTAGTLVLPLRAGVTAATFAAANVTEVAVDYHLDWNTSDPNLTKVIRGVATLPDDSNHSDNIIGPIALGQNGNIFLTEGNGSDYGSFFAMQEVGRGSFTVLTRWDLYPSYSINNLQGGASPVSLPTTFEDLDPVQGFSPFIQGPFTQLAFESGPAVSGNNVFVKVRGYKNNTVPCELLLCFNANPQAASFTIPNLGGNFTILQPDIARSDTADKTTPNVYTNASPTQYQKVEGANGTTVTFNNLSSSSTQLSQVLNESMPVIIRQAGLPDQVFDPSLTGTWNPLQWYTVVHGVDPGLNPNNQNPSALSGEPVVTGNTVFMAGNSIIKAIFQGGNPFTATPTGLLFGMNANISATDPFIAFDNQFRPYQHQLNMIQVNGANIVPCPDIRWPQTTGVTNFADFVIRLFQTSLNGQALGLSVGDGGLYAYSPNGLFGFRSANVTVVDANRIASLDTSGNTLWSSDQMDSLQSNAAVAGLLSQVKVAHQTSPTSWVFANPSHNAVGVIDVTGHSQSFTSFQLAPNYEAPGSQSGETLNLNHPSDVLQYSDYVLTDPFTGVNQTEYLQHFLVADTGNKRLVDVVYVYQVNAAHQVQFVTQTQPPILFSQSPVEFSGKNFAYSSVSRVYSALSNSYVLAASVPDGLQSSSSMGFTAVTPDPTTGIIPPQVHGSAAGSGMVVIIDGNNTQIINAMTLPAIPAGVIPVPGTSPATFQPAQAAQTVPLGTVNSVNIAPVYNAITGQTTYSVMITNQSGVYELTQDVNGNWDVDWMMTSEVFDDLLHDGAGNIFPQNPVDFRPMFARRTESGSVLIVNGYVGSTFGGSPYGGGVVEVDGSFAAAPGQPGYNVGNPFLGFSGSSLHFQLPPVQNGRPIQGPVFADRTY